MLADEDELEESFDPLPELAFVSLLVPPESDLDESDLDESDFDFAESDFPESDFPESDEEAADDEESDFDSDLADELPPVEDFAASRESLR